MTHAIRVLLVDDEQDFVRTMQKRLLRRGMDVHGVCSGQAALEKLEEFGADVVVLDVKMPQMDGIETLRRIKDRHPLVEVIMLTGHASMDAAVEGMENGAFHYLMKPAVIEELVYKLEDAYRRKALQEQRISQRHENSQTSKCIGLGSSDR